MSASKHPKTHEPSDADLKGNPGIGSSAGTAGADDEDLADGDTTFEGDVMNDTTPQGGVDPEQTGRTNK
ncbi:hypothetical protein [Rubellimicrobium aerolatum]|uniref:Sugar ABC transporter ATP-binding protein n=1 Tax=Rubellimicrobium aerolatum TaxID=490979 RepID=A0ABW0S7T0_9RHOB|nr:hypothetical protein [Rubellimicrobium aerolatum]MBP1804470.1 hypothetical protein [Rubellimicrobium aerolatum]